MRRPGGLQVEQQLDAEQLKEMFPELTALEAPLGLSVDEQIEMFRTMVLIREFEESVLELWRQDLIYGLAHSYVGSEAIAVGACAALAEEDYVTSTHRGHGHVIAKGGDVDRMMAELMGKYTGYNRGKGGSMHIAAVDKRMLGATGIVASGMPIAVGAGLSASVLGREYVTVCFHGDGATNQGVWHESINLAATWDLPVIFLCENNQWAISCPYERAAKNTDIALRALGYGIPGVTVDGFNPFTVYAAVWDARLRALDGGGPSLIVAKTYRYVGHVCTDDEPYREKATNEPWKQLDPLVRMSAYLLDGGLLTAGQMDTITLGAQNTVDEAIEYGKASPEPTGDRLHEDLYGEMQ